MIGEVTQERGALPLLAFAVARLRNSALGSAMLAVRANERSAATAGVNVVHTKLAGFAIGATGTGTASATTNGGGGGAVSMAISTSACPRKR